MNTFRLGDDPSSEHARELVDRLTVRGLRASGARHTGTPTNAVSVIAQRVDVLPLAGRVVFLLPGPRRDGLHWHWQRPLRGHPQLGARWFQPFSPAAAYDATAASIDAAIEADLRARARLSHASPVRLEGEAELERQLERQLLARVGRPLHALVHRILELLTQVEHSVEDTVLLHDLFRLDHLSTRTLRGLERLAVLGGETARQVRRPLPLATVMRQAVAQVEQYPRVRVQVPPPEVQVELPGYAGPEVALLLAELVENATRFSPPHTDVQMAAVPTPSGVRIEVTDRGLSMSADALAAMNQMVSSAEAVSLRDQIIKGPIGLLVAARLAHRHGLDVTLRPNTPHGIQALVHLPAGLLATPRSRPHPAMQPPAEPQPPSPAHPSQATVAGSDAAAPAPTRDATEPRELLPQRRRTASAPQQTPPPQQRPGTVPPDTTTPVSRGDRPALPRRSRFTGTSDTSMPAAADVGLGAPQPRGPAADLMAEFTEGIQNQKRRDESRPRGTGDQPAAAPPWPPPRAE